MTSQIENPELVSYRLTNVEKLLEELKTGLLNSIENLATREYVDLRLRNIEKAHETLMTEVAEKEKTDRQRDFQVKLAILVALASPLAAAVVGYLFTRQG